MKRTPEGVFRATTDTAEGMEEIVRIAQADPDCRWIVVKDRKLNRRGMVWRRSQGDRIDWWVLEDTEPEITWRKNKSNACS